MTSLYPHNLLLISLAAGISLYLGVLPTKGIPRGFFIQQTSVTILIWTAAAFISGLKTGVCILGCGLMATTAWRQFCRDHEFLAKLWLSGATAFGGTLCLLLLVFVPPSPAGATVWFITSVYFGALVLTTTYIPAAIAVNAERGMTFPPDFLENALTFSFLALGLRAVLVVAIFFGFPHLFPGWGSSMVDFLTHVHFPQFIGWIALGIVAPAGIGFWTLTRLKNGAKLATLRSFLALSFLSALIGEFIAPMLFF